MNRCDRALEGQSIEFDPAISQADFERQFFLAVLSRNRDHLDALRRMVEIYALSGEHDKALPLDYRLVRLLPGSCIVQYNLACSLAMTGEPDAAMDALESAVRLGYGDLAHLQVDPDLDPLRSHHRFRRLLRQFEPLEQ